MNVRDYLGRPWERFGFNCWALVREIYARELGVELPHIPIDPDSHRDLVKAFAEHPVRGLFESCRPEPLAVVELSRPGRAVGHVGVWLDADGGLILHNDRGTGVIAQPPADMLREGRIIVGYYRLRDSAA